MLAGGGSIFFYNNILSFYLYNAFKKIQEKK